MKTRSITLKAFAVSLLIPGLWIQAAEEGPTQDQAKAIFKEIENQIEAPNFVHDEGVDFGPLSPEGIEKFMSFATNAKRESQILLADLIQTPKRSEKVQILLSEMRGIVARNFPRESGLQLRIAHNRGVALVEQVVRPASLGRDISGRTQLELAILTESVRLAIAEYEPDLKYRDRLKAFHEKKGPEPTPNRARFGLAYAEKLWNQKEKHILSPIEDYALSIALMELLQWDLAKDKMNEAYSSSIVELYCQIPKKVQSKFCSQRLNPYPDQVSERMARKLLSKLQVSMDRALAEAKAVREVYAAAEEKERREEERNRMINEKRLFVAVEEFQLSDFESESCGGASSHYVGEGSELEFIELNQGEYEVDKSFRVKVLSNTFTQYPNIRAKEGCIGFTESVFVRVVEADPQVKAAQSEKTGPQNPISVEQKELDARKENIRIVRMDSNSLELEDLSDRAVCGGGTYDNNVGYGSEVEIIDPERRTINGKRDFVQVKVTFNAWRPDHEYGIIRAEEGCIGWLPAKVLKRKK